MVGGVRFERTEALDPLPPRIYVLNDRWGGRICSAKGRGAGLGARGAALVRQVGWEKGVYVCISMEVGV